MGDGKGREALQKTILNYLDEKSRINDLGVLGSYFEKLELTCSR